MVTSTLIISTAFAFGVGTGMFMSRRRREDENGGTNIPFIPHDPYHPSIIPPVIAEKTSGCIKICCQDGSSTPSVDCSAELPYITIERGSIPEEQWKAILDATVDAVKDLGSNSNSFSASLTTRRNDIHIPHMLCISVGQDQVRFACSSYKILSCAPNAIQETPNMDTNTDIRDRRIDTAIRLIQNDQAITAMRVLMGEDDDLLETNPLKDYPQDQLNERGYRKFYDSACRIAELEEENGRLQAELEALRGEK